MMCLIFLILTYVYIFLPEPYLSIIPFSSCISSITVSQAMPSTTSNTSSQMPSVNGRKPYNPNKTTPPINRQCLHPAAPLLPATSPISCLLLTSCHPMLVLAIAARRLVSQPALISAQPTVQTKLNKESIICLNCSNTILAMPRQQLSAMSNGDSNGDGQWRWQLQLPTMTERAMADGKGDGNSNGGQGLKRDGGGDGRWQLQPQQPTATATATAIGYGNIDSNSNGEGNGDGNGDGDGNCNGNVHGNGSNDKQRVASSCTSNVQRCGRGNTLPPPPWTQRKVHSPRCIMGVTLLRVFAPFEGGGFLTGHH
jgi:hypothetical protein